MQEHTCYCVDVDGLMNEFSVDHVSIEWRLFIDSSKSSFKAILQHNGNVFLSVPLFHAVEMKETYACSIS